MITRTDVRIQFCKEETIPYDKANSIPKNMTDIHEHRAETQYMLWLEEKLVEAWNK